MSTVITGHTDGAGAVLGVHGGSGPMAWLRAATGSHLYGDWDGVEWVALPAGGRAGLHTHSHTEEMWFVLRGSGEVELDGLRHRLSAGSLVLTPLGSSHAAWNTGEDPLEYVVIEVFPPSVRDMLPPRRPTDELPPRPFRAREPGPVDTSPGPDPVPGGLVTRLGPGASLDPRPYFRGPWRPLGREEVPAGADLPLSTGDGEQAVFVMTGTGTLTTGSGSWSVRPGSVATVGLGTVAVFTATTPSELFLTGLSVPR